MSRELDSTTEAEASKRAVITGHMVELYLQASTIRLTDIPHAVRWSEDGGPIKSFTGSGVLMGVSSIEEKTNLAESSVTITISGVNPTWMGVSLQYQFMGRDMRVMRAYFENGVIVGQPQTRFWGECDTISIIHNPGVEATIAITGVSRLSRVSKRFGRVASHGEQQALYPGDRGFEYMGQHDRKIIWGNTTLITKG